jgi:hypothetical protein
LATCLTEWPPLSYEAPPPPCDDLPVGEQAGWLYTLAVWVPLEHARLHAGGALPPEFVRVIRGAQYVRAELLHKMVLVADPGVSGGGRADAPVGLLTGQLPNGRYVSVEEFPVVDLSRPGDWWHMGDTGDLTGYLQYCVRAKSGDEAQLARTPVVLQSWTRSAPAMRLFLGDNAPRKDAMLSTYFTETMRLLGTRVLVKIPPEYHTLGRVPPRVRVGVG